jgi:hypothetical protein
VEEGNGGAFLSLAPSTCQRSLDRNHEPRFGFSMTWRPGSTCRLTAFFINAYILERDDWRRWLSLRHLPNNNSMRDWAKSIRPAALRAVTIRALREGYQVVGIRHGWLGAISILRDEHADNSDNFQILTEEIVNRAGRTGGTFLHTSRTNPSAVKKEEVPEALRATFNQDKNDLTSEVIKNLDWLGIDYLIPMGGDDTLSFATRLYKEGVKVIAIPKTMDNDVPGTDYCMGFSTCVSRTIELSNLTPHISRISRAISRYGSVRTLRGVHCDVANDGGRCQSMRYPRIQIRHGASDRVVVLCNRRNARAREGFHRDPTEA